MHPDHSKPTGLKTHLSQERNLGLPSPRSGLTLVLGAVEPGLPNPHGHHVRSPGTTGHGVGAVLTARTSRYLKSLVRGLKKAFGRNALLLAVEVAIQAQSETTVFVIGTVQAKKSSILTIPGLPDKNTAPSHLASTTTSTTPSHLVD